MLKRFRDSLIPIFVFLMTFGGAETGKEPDQSQISQMVKNVSSRIMCMCKDNCNKVLVNCNCTYSDGYRSEIIQLAKQGKTEDEIVQHYINQYGEIVLAAPTTSGFNLTAWLIPFVALFAGGAILWWIFTHWQHKIQSSAHTPVSTHQDVQDDALKKELEKFDF